jgi:hypothetical protein
MKNKDIIMPSQAKPSQAKPSQATAPSVNRFLSSAKKAKQDEFYTQLTDISNELKYYKSKLRGKTILCNCDDPFESNFFKYFALNFNTLGLKKLIATSYKKSPIVGGQLPLITIEGLKPEGKDPYAIEINEVPDQNGDGATDLADVEHLLKHNANTARSLKGDETYSGGDFRSRECMELLTQADIVITNPPFSLFREYMAQLITHDKQFLIIGSQSAITYKEVFKLLKNNKVWLGVDNGGTKWFRVPDDYDIQTESRKKVENGIKYFSMGSIMWFTNMDNPKRHEKITLFKKYTPEEYQKYDNYDAIEVSKVADIPVDYEGTMGVPITFFNKYNPDQFEVVGLAAGNIKGLAGIPSKTGKDGPYMNGKLKYGRILIKRKN